MKSYRSYKAVIRYNGKNFKGSQVQPKGSRTVQGVLEDSLSKLFNQKTEVLSSSRTDAGVHSEGQTIQFSSKTNLSTQVLINAINAHLPKDVACKKIGITRNDFHPTHEAKKKHYCYKIMNDKVRPVVGNDNALWISKELDLKKMKSAASVLAGKHDFKAFTAPSRKRKSTIRTVYSSKILKKGNVVEFHIVADGFLYNMVRILAGTLIEIGLNKRAESSMMSLLKMGKRLEAGYTAEAHGLTLIRVYY